MLPTYSGLGLTLRRQIAPSNGAAKREELRAMAWQRGLRDMAIAHKNQVVAAPRNGQLQEGQSQVRLARGISRSGTWSLLCRPSRGSIDRLQVVTGSEQMFREDECLRMTGSPIGLPQNDEERRALECEA